MADEQIFRKVSLERLSTPEQLDYLMQVTTPKGWYALYTMCGLLFIALVWSIVGRLPTTISGRAIIIPPRGVDDVYAPETGVVQEILVKEGDDVEAGDVVATMEQKDLAAKGAMSKTELQQKVNSTAERIRSLERQASAKKQALDQGLIASADYDSTVQGLSAARSELTGLQNQLTLGGMELKKATEVRAVKRGRIVELLASHGALIAKGDSMMTYVSRDDELNAVAFIPEVGNQARAGMKAEVSPSTIKKEEFGFMRGQVNYVSDFPARTHMMYELTRNRILNAELTANGAPYILRITLEKDPKSFSGYKWSSAGGPHEQVKAGMMCTVRVVVKEARPITLVIPALKSLLGI